MNTLNTLASIDDIRRIRWTHTNTGRWYGVSVAIRSDEKNSAMASISEPVDSRNWCDLTFVGRKIVNKLITTKGIRHVEAGAFCIIVEIEPVFAASEFHDDIIALLNDQLFGGDADVAQLGVRRADQGLIRWSNTRRECVRWYGVSTALMLDEKEDTSAVINSPVSERNWCGLTEEARELVNTIYAMKGVYTIWVTAFDLSIEIAPVFSWSDYHDSVVAMLSERIMGGKAFVEQRKSA
jgi:hypothetical protein